jgi:spore germination cell wall hydrolase CwlJ-like protein
MFSARDKIISAITLSAEADGEPRECKLWIMWTIYNRSLDKRWKGSLAKVCLSRYQFSEWNGDKINNANLIRVVSVNDSDKDWQTSLDVVNEVEKLLDSGSPNPISGVTHFYDTSIYTPSWVTGATFAGQKGSARFYKNVK